MTGALFGLKLPHLAELKEGGCALGLLLLAMDGLHRNVHIIEEFTVKLHAVATAEEHHHLHCKEANAAVKGNGHCRNKTTTAAHWPMRCSQWYLLLGILFEECEQQ
jgi:hypothetical protein